MPLGTRKKWKLRAKTEQDAGEWAYEIDEKIQTSRGFKQQAIAPQVDKWWSQYQITED